MLPEMQFAYAPPVPVIGRYVRSVRFISTCRRFSRVFNDFGDILSVEEVCEALKIGANQAYEILSKGKLKGFKQGRIWKIPKQALIQYIVEQSKIKL